ncbi:hypothetical protein [Kiloniella sp.]
MMKNVLLSLSQVWLDFEKGLIKQWLGLGLGLGLSKEAATKRAL